MKRWALLLICSLLAACAGAPPLAPPVAGVLHDAAFKPPSGPIDADAVLALSEPMRGFIVANLPAIRREGDPRRQLVDMLYRKQKLAIDYDSSTTRTAAEAFEARAGNCLSLVVMTAAFAKALELPVRFQQVFVDEAWSRSGDLYVASGHVNLALDWTNSSARFVRNLEPALVVDFLPADQLRGQRSQAIAERTVVAMFMNNRAAEALAAGAVDDAYWWARESVLQDPAFVTGHNTLGVIYLRHGMAREAQQVFDEVLAREPENTKVMGNLVHALRQQGRDAEASKVAARLAAIEPYPPFHYFNAGLEAMRAQDYAQARDLFAKELRREAYYHEFHFWLAQAELALGNVRQAQRHLLLAQQTSTTARDHDLYAAKLDRLRSYAR